MRYIPNRFRRTIEAELAPGESVLWVGQPSPQRLGRLGKPFFYFGLVWTLFFVLLLFILSGFEVPDPREHTGAFIFCSIFMAIGVLMISNLVWMRRHARKVLYVITDRRGVIVEVIRGFMLREVTPEQFEKVERRMNPDGSADLAFPEEEPQEEEETAKKSRAPTPFAFLGIFDYREAEDEMKRVLRGEAASAALQAEATAKEETAPTSDTGEGDEIDTADLEASAGRLWGILQRELREGERVRWVGRPRPSTFRGSVIFNVLGGIIFTVIGLLFLKDAFFPDGSFSLSNLGFDTLPGLILTAVGFALFGRAANRFLRARQTLYVVTDQRAIIIELGFKEKIGSWEPKDFVEVTRRELPNGAGEVVFAEERHYRRTGLFSKKTEHDWGRSLRGQEYTHTEDVGFFGIEDAQGAYRALRRIADKEAEGSQDGVA